MFNVTVLKIKDIVKYLVGTIILIGIIVYTTRFFAYKPNEQKIEKKQEKVSITETLKIKSNTLKKCLNLLGVFLHFAQVYNSIVMLFHSDKRKWFYMFLSYR